MLMDIHITHYMHIDIRLVTKKKIYFMTCKKQKKKEEKSE